MALDAVRRPSLTLADTSGRIFASYGDIVGETVHLSDLPAYVPEAAVAIEDHRFWSEPGIDPIGIGRAFMTDVTRGRIVQGGSTITQQVAKNLFLSNARTFRRKVQELILTLWLSEHFTKRQILEIWLNRIYFGAGAWGVDAAARVYFGVSARQLSLWQAAVIAGLPRAPSRFNPRVDPDAAAARAREVLAAMVSNGDITASQAQAATDRMRFPEGTVLAGGWFADWAAERAELVIPPTRMLRSSPRSIRVSSRQRSAASPPCWPARAPRITHLKLRWSCWIPPPARCVRWLAAATIRKAPIIAPRSRAVSLVPRSSPSCGSPRWSMA